MTPLTDIDEANAQLLELHSTVDEQAKEISDLREQLKQLQRHLFGRRRESVDPNQLRLFEAGQQLLAKLEQEALEAAPKEQERKPTKGHGRAPYPG